MKRRKSDLFLSVCERSRSFLVRDFPPNGAVLSFLIAGILITDAQSWEVKSHQTPDLAQNYASIDNQNNETNESYYRSPQQPVTTGTRSKRLVHGLKLQNIDRDKNVLNVLNYFVVISHAHQCSFELRRVFLDKYPASIDLIGDSKAHCVGSVRNPRCSGAMIAPNVVQTACHCLATFYKFKPDQNRTSALGKSVWEDHNIIFRPIEDPSDRYRPKPGSDSEKTLSNSPSLATFAERQFMYSKKYYIHEKCKHLDKRIFSHDFGLIILSTRYLDVPGYMFKNPRPSYNKNYKALPPDASPKHLAPLYSIPVAEENWLWVNRVEPTCLILGTGWSGWAYGVYMDLPMPWQITYAWRSATGYVSCGHWMAENLPDIQTENAWTIESLNTSYQDLATWICTITSGPILSSFSSLGDDGGPITCENRYIGILGSGFPHSKEYNYLSEVELVHSINYATESLAEYRQGLLELVEDKRPFLDPKFRPIDPVIYHKLFPPDAPVVKRSLPEPELKSGVPTEVCSSPSFLAITLLFIYCP